MLMHPFMFVVEGRLSFDFSDSSIARKMKHLRTTYIAFRAILLFKVFKTNFRTQGPGTVWTTPCTSTTIESSSVLVDA